MRLRLQGEPAQDCKMRLSSALIAMAIASISAAQIGAQQPAPTPGQQPAQSAIPEKLKPAFDVLQQFYPKNEAKRAPKAPAKQVWLFRSAQLGAGTVEVGFDDKEIVYMVFRRGTGGAGWKKEEIKSVHMGYHKDLLHETYDRNTDTFSRYNHAVAPQINGAVITRKDFDVKSLMSGI